MRSDRWLRELSVAHDRIWGDRPQADPVDGGKQREFALQATATQHLLHLVRSEYALQLLPPEKLGLDVVPRLRRAVTNVLYVGLTAFAITPPEARRYEVRNAS